jgi:pyridoxine 5-phosphate synthase
MALAPEIIKIALRFVPQKVCIVPEKRQEITTEGGLNARAKESLLKRVIPPFHEKGIEVSLFIDPEKAQVDAASRVRADAIEIHTGAYAHAKGVARGRELKRIQKIARYAASQGLIVNAGHGLDYDNVQAVAAIPEIRELNIGHSIVSRAVFVGLRSAVEEMKWQIQNASGEDLRKPQSIFYSLV